MMKFRTLQHLANGLTVSRILMIPPFMISFRDDRRLLTAIIFGVAALTDFLDGRIARKHGITSFGKFFDSLADKLLVGAALICLFGEKLIPGWMVLTIMGRELVVTGLRVLFVATQGSVVAANTWGKYKATSQMVVIFH
jgi:CDP-diacylglycerol--glycerol-3-phosphate 3-phosphatidyltransferase